VFGTGSPIENILCHDIAAKTTNQLHQTLTAYTKELDEYNELIRKFEPVSSIMDKIKQGQGNNVPYVTYARAHFFPGKP
jgi:hypothetical protein